MVQRWIEREGRKISNPVISPADKHDQIKNKLVITVVLESVYLQ